MTAPRPGSLWRHHDFRQLWMGDTVSVFGAQFVGFAMPLMAVQLLGADAFQMGLLAALESLAFLLIGLPAGAWVDRWRKKRVLVLGDLTRAALLLTLPVAWVLDALTMWQVYVVAFGVGCITVFFDVANQSYLPEIVESDQIGDGNGKLQASQQSAMVVGPAVASFMVRWLGSPLTIAVTSVCMGLSSLFVSRIRHEEPAPDPAARRPLVTEIREGLGFVLGHPLLRRIVACTGLTNLASSGIFALFVLYAVSTLGLSETTLGLVLSLGAVGGILGAVSAGRFGRLVGEGRSIPISTLLGGIALLSVPLASVLPPVPTLLAGNLLISWAVVVYNVVQVSFRQRLCPKPLLGRMNASIRFLVWGPMPIGAFLGGVLGRGLGIVPTLWILCTLALLASLPVLLSPLVRMRDLPRELDALTGIP
ncbi:MFS general substrate transporter [Serinicoccus hydrothermalis]|uniref:MFS general substrate transporter n=1 Tax=Serinicoccus hydrothermalis TaxID=1758689 RepID=A0A1B1NAV6_9MICO|nr:MFS transporter [Serinicoccus hydrothermalis]ANS78534.1 MFS general substrate transporter [Serinicoccus hydrothermalis]